MLGGLTEQVNEGDDTNATTSRIYFITQAKIALPTFRCSPTRKTSVFGLSDRPFFADFPGSAPLAR
jgi:hypothetical protein